ncbi:hypothetical protein ACLOJK_010168 [Asimina triloba]
MNGKESGIKIDICVQPNGAKGAQNGDKSDDDGGFAFMGWIRSVWSFCREDSNRVIFALKVGLAVLLVSLLILFRAPYEIFGANIIWSILTVAIMFEYTVGATFNRGFNRALGSLLAGIFAIAVIRVAMCTGRVVEPLIIGLSIFLIGALTSFMKLWPSLVPYEYGFRVILFTFCLIIVSGYRMGNPVRTAMDRLYSIAIGGLVAVLVNLLIFPIWAGEQLHRELVGSFDSVADALEGTYFNTSYGFNVAECVRKYLDDDGSDHPEFSKTVNDEFADEPAFRKCRATLNSSAKLDSLANSAKWEPPHGRFKHFFYPWSEYVKVGAVLRYCAYEVMALHGVLHSEIQVPFPPPPCHAPHNLRFAFESEIMGATKHAAELVRSLGKDINSMKRSLQTALLKRVHDSTERLQRSIDVHSYLLTASSHDLIDNSSSKPLRLSTALSDDTNTNLDDLINYSTTSGPGLLLQNAPPIISSAHVALSRAESYHESMKRQQRRLHSWPSREVDGFEEEGGGIDMDLIPRMKALECTTSLSLATFTSLLIEFVARLDHLVEAVDKLAKQANFNHEAAVK